MSRMVWKRARPPAGPGPEKAHRAGEAWGWTSAPVPWPSICCSPPLRVPASWPGPFPQDREKLEHLLYRIFHPFFIPAPGESSQLEIFSDRHLGKQFSSLRTLGDAQPNDVVGGKGVDAPAFKGLGACGRLKKTGDGFQKGGLARAVGPQQGDDLSFLNGQGEVFKGEK